MDDPPEITILLLGDAECGKSAFLARLSQGHDTRPPRPTSTSNPTSSPGASTSPLNLTTSSTTLPPAYTSTTTLPPAYSPPSQAPPTPLPLSSLPHLHDLDQPFIFTIRLFNRAYHFQFYDTSSPTSYTLLVPDVLVVCYDISSRASLDSVTSRWKKEIMLHFASNRDVPTMLLGLKRDLRGKIDAGAASTGGGGGGGIGRGSGSSAMGSRGGAQQAAPPPPGPSNPTTDIHIIYPHEAVGVAQSLRCDRYAECSAATGELMFEVFEDLARMAAGTTTDGGGLSLGTSCVIL
ncbi:MAG: hypothetical protein M1819_007004 [Sarea resinae]|nr:MAG: hypothetical protein M1819_007004 [Sarea resinae]